MCLTRKGFYALVAIIFTVVIIFIFSLNFLSSITKDDPFQIKPSFQNGMENQFHRTPSTFLHFEQTLQFRRLLSARHSRGPFITKSPSTYPHKSSQFPASSTILLKNKFNSLSNIPVFREFIVNRHAETDSGSLSRAFSQNDASITTLKPWKIPSYYKLPKSEENERLLLSFIISSLFDKLDNKNVQREYDKSNFNNFFRFQQPPESNERIYASNRIKREAPRLYKASWRSQLAGYKSHGGQGEVHGNIFSQYSKSWRNLEQGCSRSLNKQSHRSILKSKSMSRSRSRSRPCRNIHPNNVHGVGGSNGHEVHTAPRILNKHRLSHRPRLDFGFQADDSSSTLPPNPWVKDLVSVGCDIDPGRDAKYSFRKTPGFVNCSKMDLQKMKSNMHVVVGNLSRL